MSLFASFTGFSEAQVAVVEPKVRVAYLVPFDKVEKASYTAAIKNAMLSIQDFYRQQLGSGKTFQIDDRMVEVYHTSHPAAWYATNNAAAHNTWVVWSNADDDASSLIAGYRSDPDTTWVVYIDADYLCGQNGGGGVTGITIMPAPDLRGLSGESPNLVCLGDPAVNTYHQNRWIGGLGHEFGHSLGLPHPPGCDASVATCDSNALMYLGYFNYPNTYLRVDDKSTLNASPFISWRPISDAVFDYYEFTESNWFFSHQQSTLDASGWYQRSYFATNSSLHVLQNPSVHSALMYVYRGGIATIANAQTVFKRKVKTINAAQLISKSSSICADTFLGGTADGTEVIQYTCGSAPNMRWNLHPASSGSYQIINKKSRSCLRPVDGTTSTSDVEIYTCTTDISMNWDILPVDMGYYQLRNKKSGKCLTSPGAGDWLNLRQITCDSSNTKSWQVMR